ncbi:hypothetical protein Slin15195_G076550 [Septoria linicola]|uniref:Uncharacterized protein n=1 Tax=Septoria linicola TaxID=215465 RepID=A0A9Q9AZ09_9PEZI|nr:hypothetical protein Slin14017_G037670 [Septoria linicola]USW54336.1 hypothetical protein Slin15195_G076550 [Septoria linicola]
MDIADLSSGQAGDSIPEINMASTSPATSRANFPSKPSCLKLLKEHKREQPSFFRLPTEVRDLIYERLVDTVKVRPNTSWESPVPYAALGSVQHVNARLICKRFSRECTSQIAYKYKYKHKRATLQIQRFRPKKELSSLGPVAMAGIWGHLAAVTRFTLYVEDGLMECPWNTAAPEPGHWDNTRRTVQKLLTLLPVLKRLDIALLVIDVDLRQILDGATLLTAVDWLLHGTLPPQGDQYRIRIFALVHCRQYSAWPLAHEPQTSFAALDIPKYCHHMNYHPKNSMVLRMTASRDSATIRGLQVEVTRKLPAFDLQSAYEDVKAMILREASPRSSYRAL